MTADLRLLGCLAGGSLLSPHPHTLCREQCPLPRCTGARAALARAGIDFRKKVPFFCWSAHMQQVSSAIRVKQVEM